MKAMTIEGFGAASDVFRQAEIPKPDTAPGRVLVRVAASSVNPVDYKIRSGLLEAIAPEEPRVLGCDLSGTVEAVGDGVAGFAPGDEVFGCTGGMAGNPGALAEFQLCDPALLAKKPTNIDLSDAAAVPLVAITCWDALVRATSVQKGERVLVHGGCGGVGHMGVQLAAARGAEVFATISSPEKAEIVRRYGATPINYREQGIADYVAEHTGGAGFDVVFDTIGGDNLPGCFEAAALEGRVASVNTRTTCDLSLLHQKALSLHVVFMLIPILHGQAEGRRRHGEILREVAALIEAGKIAPLIHEQRFPFSEVAAAHELLESGRATGKILLTGF